MEPSDMFASPDSAVQTAVDNAVYFERERGVTEVRVVRGLAHITVLLPEESIEESRLSLLRRLASGNVPVFMVKLHPSAISFAVREDEIAECESVLAEHGQPFTLLRDLGLTTIYAGAMRDLSGVIARIYRAMVLEGISVRQTGDAYNAVHCLVNGSEVDRAAGALRREFSLPDPISIEPGGATASGL